MKNMLRTSTIGLLLGSLLVSGAMAHDGGGLTGQSEAATGQEASVPELIRDDGTTPVLEQPADDISVTVEPVVGSVQQVTLQMAPQPSAGYAIHITRIDFIDNTAYIHYDVQEPAPGSFNATVITEPSTSTFVDASYEIEIVRATGGGVDPNEPVIGLPEPGLEQTLPEDEPIHDGDEAAIAHYTGTISDIQLASDHENDVSWLARLELTTEGEEEPYDRIIFYIQEETEIFKLENGDPASATVDDLESGQNIEVTTSGPAMLSYPMQVSADTVTIQ